LAEYREEFTECADCHVALVAGLLPQPAKQTEVEFVTVLETRDPVALNLAKASLEEAGIEYLMASGGGASALMGLAYYPGFCRIQVAREDEEEARTLLEPLQEPSPDPGETGSAS
jgi:hypothetical protein